MEKVYTNEGIKTIIRVNSSKERRTDMVFKHIKTKDSTRASS